MTGLCMWHGSFIRVTWLIDTIWHDSIMRDLNHSFVRHLRILGYTLQYCNNASQHHPQQPPISCRFVTWLFEMCDMTHADVTHSSLCHVDVLVREVGNSTVRVWVMSCLSCLRMSHVSQVHTNESRHTRAHERVTSRTCLGYVAHVHIQMSHTNASRHPSIFDWRTGQSTERIRMCNMTHLCMTWLILSLIILYTHSAIQKSLPCNTHISVEHHCVTLYYNAKGCHTLEHTAACTTSCNVTQAHQCQACNTLQ